MGGYFQQEQLPALLFPVEKELQVRPPHPNLLAGSEENKSFIFTVTKMRQEDV